MNDPLGYGFHFAGEAFIARPSGALWWPAREMLVVSDLHLGRSERNARRGGALLPPYENADSLERLAGEILALSPRRVTSLGDSFDDMTAARNLSPQTFGRLNALAQGREWYWVKGNHDPEPLPNSLAGRIVAEMSGPIALRHEAGQGPDISGHLHPSTLLARQRWRCFVKGEAHVILPAFGTYTGGLDISDPAIAELAPRGIAIACAPRMFALPIGSL